jgi:type I restriction enzyme S subunit
MKLLFDVTATEFQIIREVLATHLGDDCQVWVFGSRAKNTARFNSDLDLAIECTHPLSKKDLIALNEAFDEAKLAFSVDVVDLKTVEPYFKEIIDSHKVVFPYPHPNPLPEGEGVDSAEHAVNSLSLGERARVRAQNEPQLRFPEFSGEWVEKKIGSICDFIVPGRNKPENFDGEIPWITTPDIEQNGRVLCSKKNLRITKSEAKSIGSKIVPENSIIMSCVGELGLLAIAGCKLVINQQLHAFIPNDGDDYKFLLYSLTNQKSYMEKVATKTAVPYMNKDNCNSIPVTVPSLPEQTKIATFLSAVDTKIDQLTQKKALLETYKKGAMQQIFSQQIRFKADDGGEYPEWEEKKLGEVANRKTLKNKENKYKYVLTNSATQGVVSQQDYFDKDIANQNNLEGYYIVDVDDFVYNPRISVFAPVGPIKRNKLAKGIMSPLYTVFAFNENVSLCFMEMFFSTNMWHDYMLSISNFGARHDRMNITTKDFIEMPILLPCLEEQTKIANFLSAIDQKIDFVSQQLEQAKAFKKGLLQQMFV